jgi:hypothetical protein
MRESGISGASTPATNKKRNDLIFISALLLLVLLSGSALLLFRSEGDRAVVTLDGRTVGEYSLSEDREVRIESDGGGYNILVIKDGKASVSSASCPDGICSSHRSIKMKGESIICLPNKVVVEIRNEKTDQPDIIS